MGRGKEDIIAGIRNLAKRELMAPVTTSDPKYKEIAEELEKLRLRFIEGRIEREKRDREAEAVIAGVAHDLKTPLAIISGYAECLEAGMTDKDYCALILEKTEQMNEQVLTIVEANRKNDDNHDVHELIDIKEFLERECNNYRPVAEKKGIELVLTKFPEEQIYYRKKELSAIIQNIITNAIKYTKEGGTVTVSCKKHSKYLLFKVKDNGIGIGKEDIPHIFEKYYMADKSRSDYQSSGLGLYTVKETAERNGGFVKVRSKKGKGSTFFINLPRNAKKKRRGFEDFTRIEKLLAAFFGFVLFGPIHRVVTAVNNNDPKNLIATILSLPLCVFIWIIDMVDIVVNNKISLFVK